MNWLPALGDEYFRGVLRVIREGQGVRFARMTPRQLAYFEQKEAWGIRARCAAGVTLDLETDSPWLDIKFEILSSCRKFLGIDVEVAGVLLCGVRVDEHNGVYSGRPFDITELVARDKRKPGQGHQPDQPLRRPVRIHLPYTCEIRLLEVGMPEGASVAAMPPQAHRLLALGDSITQGMEARSPFSSYPVQLARLLNADLLNQGVGGHIFDAAALDPSLEFQPDMVTVAYGTNDWGQKDAEQFRCDVREYLRKLRAMWSVEQTRIAVISPLWRTGMLEEKKGADLADFMEVIWQETAKVEGASWVPGMALVPHQPWYYADGLHPNDAGFMHYSLNLYAALTKGLKWPG